MDFKLIMPDHLFDYREFGFNISNRFSIPFSSIYPKTPLTGYNSPSSPEPMTDKRKEELNFLIKKYDLFNRKEVYYWFLTLPVDIEKYRILRYLDFEQPDLEFYVAVHEQYFHHLTKGTLSIGQTFHDAEPDRVYIDRSDNTINLFLNEEISALPKEISFVLSINTVAS